MKALEALRKEKRVSMKRLAQALNVSVMTYSHKEKGRTGFTAAQKRKVCKALDAPETDVLWPTTKSDMLNSLAATTGIKTNSITRWANYGLIPLGRRDLSDLSESLYYVRACKIMKSAGLTLGKMRQAVSHLKHWREPGTGGGWICILNCGLIYYYEKWDDIAYLVSRAPSATVIKLPEAC